MNDPTPQPCEHVAGFYHSDHFLADRVASFITEGLSHGDQVIVLATDSKWATIARRLIEEGVPCRRAVAERRLVLVDADAVLAAITIEGQVSVEAFQAALARFINPGVKQRIYGELVSLLIARGHLETAIAIESVGHVLAHSLNIPVLCGYHLGGEQPISKDAIDSLEAVHDRSWSEDRQARAADEIDVEGPGHATGFHAVRFYDSRESLAKIVGKYVGEGFVAGVPAIVIATPEHREAIASELDAHYFDLERLQVANELVLLDAADVLSRVMHEGMPDAAKFTDALTPAIERVRRGRHGCVIRAYGEMVDVLRHAGQAAAAVRLEMLWTQLAQAHSFALLCGYSMGCREHSHLPPVPGERFTLH